MNNVCKIALERGNSIRQSPQREASLEQGWKWKKALWLQQSLKMIMLHVVLKIFKSQAIQGTCMLWKGLVFISRTKKNSLRALGKKLSQTSVWGTDWRKRKLDESSLSKCRVTIMMEIK